MLIDLAPNHETRFFRDKAIFSSLHRLLEYKLQINRTRPPEFAFWCCACSTGQEAFSLAITCEELKEKGFSFDYSILATDLSQAALSQAESGTYTNLEVQQGLSAAKLKKWFEKKSPTDNELWQAKPVLRKNIVFSAQDLLQPFNNQSLFDVILCRNVLLYFDSLHKQAMLARLGRCLKRDGYLILGADESLIDFDTEFYPVAFEKNTFYQFDHSLALAQSIHNETAS